MPLGLWERREFLLYLAVLQAFGCTVFFFGFFPVNQIVSDEDSSESDLPLFVNQHKLNVELLYKRRISKLVIMLIDGLRFDFVWNNSPSHLFPYLSSQLNENCLLKMKAELPTVTLPRIKSIVTGTVPSFYDVIRNLGSVALREDSFIRQASRHKITSVFYGDETWLKLFPQSFKRHEGTTSFFASDYTEVDRNVTRNVNKELVRNDWDVMILHYLGLDHIGHIEGPKSRLVEPKLLEMDRIIQKLHQHLSEIGVLIICGDHGMKDSGGHGGSSSAEIIVPFVLLNYNCDISSRRVESQQIDAAPIISALLGLPIPTGSLGTVHLSQLRYFGLKSSLYVMYYNTHRMWQKIASDKLKDELFEEYQKGNFSYEKCIKSGYVGDSCTNAADSFSIIQNKMSSSAVKESITFDLYLMLVGVILLAQNVLLISTRPNITANWLSLVESLVGSLWISTIMHSIGCAVTQTETVICQTEATSFFSIFLVLAVLSYNFYLIRKTKIAKEVAKHQLTVTLPTILQALSVFSSSYIEEEHEYWHFICISLVNILLWVERGSLNRLWTWLLLAVTLRFLRSINQVGDKWSSLSDLSDWLTMEENRETLTYFSILGLILLFICDIDLTMQLTRSQKPILIETSLSFLQLTFIFLQKVASGKCTIGFAYLQSSGTTESSIFWLLTITKLVVSTSMTDESNNPNEAFHRIINKTLKILMFTVAFLVRPYNLLFIPSLYGFSKNVSKYFHFDDLALALSHYWMAANFFFMMGNWNNLASVDVSVGYTGLKEFSMVITGIYLGIHTYAAHIISFFLLLNNLSYRDRFFKSEMDVYRALLFHNGFPLLMSSVVMLIQRHHLFVWTVFAPKLLFISCQTILVAFLVIYSAAIASYCSLIEE